LPDHFGIETDAGELDEIFVVGLRKIDQARTARFDHLPSLGEIVLGNTQFGGEDVHRADREDAKLHGGTPNAIDYFVDRSVTAGGNDGAVSLPDGPGGEISSIPRRAGTSHEHMVGKRGDVVPQGLGALAAGRRVQNDKDLMLPVHASHSGKVS
jgi:hypothetical protein